MRQKSCQGKREWGEGEKGKGKSEKVLGVVFKTSISLHTIAFD